MLLSRRAVVMLVSLAAAAPLDAQTTDPIFARWRWAPPSLGSRPAGLGGAYVALADSVKGAYVNPAGLTLIPIKEISLSSGRPWFGAAVGNRKLRAAAYVTKADDTRVEWDGPAAPNAGSTRPFVESSAWESGLALGAQPFARVKLGAAVSWSALRMRGEDVRIAATGVRRTVLEGDGGELRVSAGVLIDLLAHGGFKQLPALRLGLSYLGGYDWSVDQSEGPLGAGQLARQPVDIRRPTVIAAGLALRFTDRWSFSAQGDIVRYREVIATLRRNVGGLAAQFSLPDKIEPRFGSEFAWPLTCGCGVMKFRGGLRYESSGTLHYRGSDAALIAAFPGKLGRAAFSSGASFFAEYFGQAVRFDVDSKDLFQGPALSFGIVWRF